jgi:amidohydrolase
VNGWNQELRQEIKSGAESLTGKVVEFRRDFHRHPERSKREERTAGIVAQHLESLGIEVKRCEGNFGVIGTLRCASDGKTVGLRADMDALKLQEETGLPFASEVDGIMHACGHDAHTAMLMGVAELLTSLKDRLKGNVRFLFQPSEEAFPGGALGMIDEGAMEDPHVDAVFAWHVMSNLPSGKVGLTVGPVLGGVTSVNIHVKGVGGHFSTPHLAVDPIVLAANVLVALQSLMTRQVDPMESAVLTFGTISGGTRDNVIGDEVIIRGNLGAMNDELRLTLSEKIEKCAIGVAESMGGSAEVKLWHGYPTTANEAGMTDFARAVAVEEVGEENVVEMDRVLGGEDFSYFLQKAPGAMLRLGVWDTENLSEPTHHHHPCFQIDEKALPLGVSILSQIAARYLLS